MGRFVSVVIAAYQAEKHIGQTLQSALAQTHSELEIIIVDDGSTDSTAEIARSTGDPRVQLIRQANAGQSAALNRGIASAAGDYIKFLDADDLLNPGHIASQLSVLRGTTDCLASCRWRYFVEEPSTSSLREEHTNRDYENPLDWLIDSLTLDEGMMGGWKWLIPRNVLQRAGGWNESLTLNNDFDFSVRILLGSNGVRFAQDAIYFYRKGIESSLSGTISRRAMKSAFETTKLGCQNLIARENSERIKRACADRWQWWLYHFYPEYSDLAELAENEIRRLGGSSKPLEGGRLLRALVPIIGWKAVRRLQVQVYRWGWSPILKWKEQRRIRFIDGRDR